MKEEVKSEMKEVKVTTAMEEEKMDMEEEKIETKEANTETEGKPSSALIPVTIERCEAVEDNDDLYSVYPVSYNQSCDYESHAKQIRQCK